MPPIDLGDLGSIDVTPEVAGKLTANLTDEERRNLFDELKKKSPTESSEAMTKVSDYPHLHPADDVSLDPEQNGGKILNQGYLKYNGKKVPMFRNEDIPQAFNEMSITVKDFENTAEGKEQATAYLQELFKDYKADFPDAFAETDWFGTYNKTKFKLFDKRATDHGLDYAGYQDSAGRHGRPGEALCSWLPVRIGGKFACLFSDRTNEEATCYYGNESDALPVATSFAQAA